MTGKEFLESREAMLWVKEWLDKNPHIALLGVGTVRNWDVSATFPAYVFGPRKYKMSEPILENYYDGTAAGLIYLIRKEYMDQYREVLSKKSFKIPELLMELMQETQLTKRKLIL